MKIAVIGAGWTGLTCAYLLSRARDGATYRHRVTVIEQREHLGGNAYDERVDGEILPRYGAHIFHTQNKQVWKFVNRFASFTNYKHRVSVSWNGSHLDYPITTEAVSQVYGRKLSDRAVAALLAEEGKPWHERANENFETACLSKMGQRLYDIYVAPYTRKMWGREPHTLSARLAARVPVRLGGCANLFTDTYQGMPEGGYGRLFERMADRLSIIWDDYRNVPLGKFDHVIVTSPLDEWYGYQLGKLEYRGMRFERERINYAGYVLPTGTVNANDSPNVLRIEEPKRYYASPNAPAQEHTTLVYNYADGETQFYPVPDARNDELAEQYRKRAAKEPHVTFLGRLGTYRYLNMDQAILQAMQAVARW